MISVSGICFSYGRQPVLNGAEFTAKKGQCVGIAGSNGCGKSTLLSILAGVLRPSGGRILYDGQDALRDRNLFSAYTGFVPQENPLIEELTVWDNLRLWYGGSRKDLREEIRLGPPAMLGIDGSLRKTVSRLSGGMKKRLSIACALAGNPRILILDEPSAALDLICKSDIRRYLRAYMDQGGTVVLTTHEESELDLCHKLYIMEQGRLSEVSPGLRGDALVSLLKRTT